MNCIRCGREGAYSFRALEVETLPVRDLKGEKKVQALREFHDFAVCRDCAEATLFQALHPEKKVRVRIALFLLLFAAGAALSILFWRSNGALRLMGLAACFLGMAGAFTVGKAPKQRQAAYRQLSDSDALFRAAWDCAVENAPKKRGDSHLSYIPITPETLARKNGDLMILYDLLPAIAVEAHKRLHSESLPDTPPSAETI